MRYTYLILTLSLLLSIHSSTARAEECPARATVTEAGKRYSVVLGKVSGMEAQTYDDIGCAVVSRNGECATRQGIFDSNAVAYDYLSGDQIPVEKAFFVLRTDIATPRAYGIVAFKDKAEAEKFSASHGKGKVVKWFELVDEKLK